MKRKIHNTNKTFHVLDLATRICADCVELTGKIHHPFGDVTSQLTRAALSIPLNITEGAGRTGRARKNHYAIAYGSARETTTALEILVRTRRLESEQVNETLDMLDQVRAILWTLINANDSRR